MRGPARSSRAGATHRSVPVRSRAQASSRSRPLSICAQFTTATVSARKSVHGRGHAVHPAGHRDARDLALVPPAARHARGHDGQAMGGVPAQCRDHLCHRARRAHHHRPAGADPEAPLAVQPLAEPVPGEHVQGGERGQGEDHVAARQVQLRGVGEDGDGGGQAHARTQDAAEFLRSGADDPAVVPAGQRDRGPPQQGQGERQRQVHVRRVDPGVVADVVRRRTGQQGAGHVDQGRHREIAVLPDGCGPCPEGIRSPASGRDRQRLPTETHPPPSPLVRCTPHLPLVRGR